jgi:hypothetical protein
MLLALIYTVLYRSASGFPAETQASLRLSILVCRSPSVSLIALHSHPLNDRSSNRARLA